MSYENPDCAHCRDTGRKLLDNGEHSDFLDCRHCNAAKERAELEDWATNMVLINRIGYDDGGLRWALHQRAREIEHQEQAVAIAKLSSERDKAESRIVSSTDAFKRIAQAHHAALVAGNGDAGEIAKLAAYLGLAPHIDAQAARIAELEAQIAAAYAPADTDKLREAWTKDAEEFGGALNEAGWEFIENAPQGGMPAILFNNLKPVLRAAILKYAEKVSASTALQAPVREVPLVNDTKYTEAEKAIGEIIFERYPRIKGVHCASITTGILEYMGLRHSALNYEPHEQEHE